MEKTTNSRLHSYHNRTLRSRNGKSSSHESSPCRHSNLTVTSVAEISADKAVANSLPIAIIIRTKRTAAASVKHWEDFKAKREKLGLGLPVLVH